MERVHGQMPDNVMCTQTTMQICTRGDVAHSPNERINQLLMVHDAGSRLQERRAGYDDANTAQTTHCHGEGNGAVKKEDNGAVKGNIMK